MSGGFDLTPADLQTAAGGLDEVRGRLATAIGQLQSSISGAGNPWGADEQGSLFGELFTEVLTHVTEVMQTHADQLDYAAAALRDSADAHVENDQAVAAMFDRLGSGA